MNFMLTISQLAAKVNTTSIVLYVLLALMVVALLVFPTISRRRQMKEFTQMMDNLSVGDQIMTNTGMIGTIKKINRKADGVTFLLETGEKTVIEFDVGAIARILHSVNPIPVAEKAKKKEENTEAAKAQVQQPEEKQAEVKQEVKQEAKPEENKPKVAKVKKTDNK